MSENQNDDDFEGWDAQERRAAKRRYAMDRRIAERRKKYWINLFLPIVVGVVATGVMSWGVYVTHTTFSISAKYEETFTKHIKNEAVDEVRDDLRMDAMVLDYNTKIIKLGDDMSEGFTSIYNLLVTHEKKRNADADSE